MKPSARVLFQHSTTLKRSTAEKHRQKLNELSQKLGLKTLDDWYSVPATQIRKEAQFMFDRYGSQVNMLKQLFPQHDWNPLRFSSVPRGYWNDESAQRDALERYGRDHLGIKQLDDWYNVSATDVASKLSFISSRYHSLFNALKKLYPQHEWDPLKFSRQVPHGYWNDENAQRDALERFGREHLGIKELDDWYNVPITSVSSELSFIYSHHKGSLYGALKKLYPQHEWNPIRFNRAPQHYYQDVSAQREALERFGRERLGIKELDDWYNVPAADVRKTFRFINQRYTGSLFDILSRIYPEHEWNPLRFQQIPHGYWKQSNTVQFYHKLFTKWREDYNIKNRRDWLNLAPQQVKLFKDASKGIFGGQMKLLQRWFPDTNWCHSSAFGSAQLELRVTNE